MILPYSFLFISYSPPPPCFPPNNWKKQLPFGKHFIYARPKNIILHLSSNVILTTTRGGKCHFTDEEETEAQRWEYPSQAQLTISVDGRTGQSENLQCDLGLFWPHPSFDESNQDWTGGTEVCLLAKGGGVGLQSMPWFWRNPSSLQASVSTA